MSYDENTSVVLKMLKRGPGEPGLVSSCFSFSPAGPEPGVEYELGTDSRVLL